jgi:type II secretory pathway predicted ATPase ExeA
VSEVNHDLRYGGRIDDQVSSLPPSCGRTSYPFYPYRIVLELLVYESHYGFSKAPFSINPDPAFLYLNSNYREAIALLQYGIQEHKGIVTLVGEVGTGKTMLLNQLLQSLDPGAASIMIPTVRFPYHDLVGYLLDKLNPSPGSFHNKTRFDVLYDLLISRDLEGKPVVVLVDEAQDLDNDTLESIRLLSNLETPSRKLLQIILVGQPELRHKLNLPELRQLKQRIAISFTLKPLSADETPSYIAHRLQGAGYLQGTTLFTDDALELIAHYSNGIPRVVNAICDNALLIGFAANRRWIDSAMIVEAAQDLMLDPLEVHPAAESGKVDSAAVAVVPPAGANAQRGAGGLGRWVYVVAVLSVAIGASYAGLRFDPTHWQERLGELATSAEGLRAWLFSADPNGGKSSYRVEPQASDNEDPVSSLPSADPSAEGKLVKPHADAPAPVPTDNEDPVSLLPSADPSAEGKLVKPHADAPAPVPPAMLSVACSAQNDLRQNAKWFETTRGRPSPR